MKQRMILLVVIGLLPILPACTRENPIQEIKSNATEYVAIEQTVELAGQSSLFIDGAAFSGPTDANIVYTMDMSNAEEVSRIRLKT